MIVMDGIQVTLAGVVHNIQPHDLERYLQIGWERVVSDGTKPQALTPEATPKVKDSGKIRARSPRKTK